VFSVGSYGLTYDYTSAMSSNTDPTAGSHGLQEPKHYDGSTSLTIGVAVSQQDQIDVYSFQAPGWSPDGVMINLQDWGVGLAAPNLTVYDSLGIALGTSAGTGAASTSAAMHLPLFVPNATYYVRAENGRINPNGAGTYLLSVSFTAPSGPSASSFTSATPWFGSDQTDHGQSNGNRQNSAKLETRAGNAQPSHYRAIEGISSSQSQQFYTFETPRGQDGQTEVLTASVQVLGAGGLLPWISVFDDSGNKLDTRILSEQDGYAVVQVPVTDPGTLYVLEVSSAQTGGAQVVGNFALDVSFGNTPAATASISSGTLPAAPAGSSTGQVSTTLAIGQSQLFTFVLAGSGSNTATDAVLQMTLMDSSGKVISTLSTAASLARGLVVFLPTGNYTILIGVTSPPARPISNLAYSPAGTNLTDPIKVYPSSGSSGTRYGR